MKPFISPTFYGVINWTTSLLLITSPWFLGYYKFGGCALLLPMLIGWLQLLMAIFGTNKTGLVRVFPLQMHLFLDVITGSFLLASPFVYAFSDKVFWPQLILGSIIFLAGIFTQSSPFTTKPPHTQPEGLITSTDYQEKSLMN